MSKTHNLNMKELKKLDVFGENAEQVALDVTKESIEDVIEEANKPVSAGGRMRVDTGFLRSSGVGAVNQIPSGPSEGIKRKAGQTGIIYNYTIQPVLSALINLKDGDTFYYGWTARYAEIREAYDGFVASAVQKWDEIVDNNVRRLKK